MLLEADRDSHSAPVLLPNPLVEVLDTWGHNDCDYCKCPATCDGQIRQLMGHFGRRIRAFFRRSLPQPMNTESKRYLADFTCRGEIVGSEISSKYNRIVY